MKLLGEFSHSEYRKHRDEEAIALGNLFGEFFVSDSPESSLTLSFPP